MNYAEKVKFAREKLKLTRMEFAKLLDTTERYVENIEMCKDGSKKFGRKKENTIIKTANLPPGFFVDGPIDVKAMQLSDEEMFYRLFSDAEQYNISYDEVREVVKLLAKVKSGR